VTIEWISLRKSGAVVGKKGRRRGVKVSNQIAIHGSLPHSLTGLTAAQGY
jgi:hypothetical protein